MKRNRKWIRLDVDYKDSDWLADLPGDVRRLWPDLLCHVKANGMGGKCRVLSANALAKKIDATPEQVDKLLTAALLEGALQVVTTEHGKDWEITNWYDYQDPSGQSAIRMKNKRQRDKQAGELMVEPTGGTAHEQQPTPAISLGRIPPVRLA